MAQWGLEKNEASSLLQSLVIAEEHMETLMLNETEVQRLLDPDMLLDALAEGFMALSQGLVNAPNRIGVSVPDTGFLLSMPVYQHGREITVKLVSVFHDNNRFGIPSHQAVICLF